MILKNSNRLFVVIGLIILIIAGRYVIMSQEVVEIPTVQVVTQTEVIPSVAGSYCWHSAGEGKCVDTAAPHEMIESKQLPYVTVAPNETIEFQYSQKPTSISVQQWIEDFNYEEISTSARFTAPSEKGTYIISSIARFSNGDRTDSIAIEVK
ncbi:cAMP-binding protein [Solibacillus sp. FSL R7-0668]|uniref:cAMP-binding protein n=1 Tax=Solibacillus sp. FSL R7-0668 TaxID=2921688 RepID=UPI0030F5F2E3